MIFLILILYFPVIVLLIKLIKYKKLEREVLKSLGLASWNIFSAYDKTINVKSRTALENYDDIKFFKDYREDFAQAERIIDIKNGLTAKLSQILQDNGHKNKIEYRLLKKQILKVLENPVAYNICVKYISSAGNHLGEKTIKITQYRINTFKQNPSLLMSKGEYNKYVKEQQAEALKKKHHDFYEKVNNIIDYANENRDSLVIKGSQDQLDILISKLFDGTVNSIEKIKTLDSEEWNIIGNFIYDIDIKIKKIVGENQRILEYYDSPSFLKIKETCEVLMNSQKEFNEYLTEKVQSISTLFGTRVVRNETINEDEFNYIRPYKKTITPFTAEISSAVFSSAENNPLGYIVKNFYPNKERYPEQIHNLYLLVEELETLKDAKQIIENYKAEYQQYLVDVPNYVMNNDEDGFYSRLGFAIINESVLTVEYKFSHTSNGGKAQRSFTVPMTIENISELIKILESKLTAKAFAKEQRALMTKKLREFIKTRDNFTCCTCGNSSLVEPNLLLEIDHIIPVSKGGPTKEDNLQTLCWKCNRTKSDKIIN